MTGNLDVALETLIREALPGLFGGDPPLVELDVSSGAFEIDPESADVVAGEPRQGDRRDNFPFDPDNPQGPYTLTQPPYPGPRHVRLTTDLGDRIPLSRGEVLWDEVDSRVFTLDLRPHRELADITGVQVLYGVTAVFTQVKATQQLTMLLNGSDEEQVEQAEALVIAVVDLNRQSLVDQARATYEEGDYGADVEVKSLNLLNGLSPSPTQRIFTFQAEVELRVRRALGADEGRPIERIRTPGRPLDPDRPIDIHIEIGG